jgi:hypothetical protein
VLFHNCRSQAIALIEGFECNWDFSPTELGISPKLQALTLQAFH